MPNNEMAYIRTKKIKGKTYYYIVEGRKIDGRFKQKVLYYIGTIQNLIKKLTIADKILKNKAG